MIELDRDQLVVSFPKVHPDARCVVEFQRTLRIPDDGHEYPLPAGLGRFPLRHVDDFARTVPTTWSRHGGVMMPMYLAEALWVSFHAFGYPFAIKIAAGSVNAVTGDRWDSVLHFGASPSDGDRVSRAPVQDYVVVPDQPWLDGFNVGSGRIRQFVAMPLGQGFSAEEQITGRAEYGGLQIVAYPMKAQSYERWRRQRPVRAWAAADAGVMSAMAAAPDMGLGAGGLMRQRITVDPHEPDVWDTDHASRCFVHLANSLLWAAITSDAPPTRPPTASEYRAAGIPWFDYYDAGEALPGSSVLARLDSVATIAAANGDPLPENDSVPVDRVTVLRPRPVREHPERI